MRRFLSIICAGFLACGCFGKGGESFVEPPKGRTLSSFQATAEKGMVVTSNAEASQIGLEILKRGGNAIDAAIAVSFALSVVRPQSTGLGGGGFLLFHDKGNQKNIAIDFRERAPRKADRDMYLRNGMADATLSQEGGLAVAVPHLVAGLGFLYDNFAGGKLKWSELVEPSVALAEKGFPVYPGLEEAIGKERDLLEKFPTSREIFLPENQIPRTGDLLVQKDLSKTLTTIAQTGWQSFYKGSIASGMVQSVQNAGGILDWHDLQALSVRELEPVAGTYRGYRIVSMPPPSSGGIVLIETLQVLDHFRFPRSSPHHPDNMHLVTEALRRTFQDRAFYLGDDRFVKVPLKGLLSREYAEILARSVDRKKATPSGSLSPVPMQLRESDSTTHFSIVDPFGNAVASTQTINTLFGSGVTARGTGVVLNNEMDDFSIRPGVPNTFGLIGSEANAIAPGKTPLSSMSPTFVFDDDGKLQMVLGSPGGPKIITSVLHTLLNRIDFGDSPLEAVARKRYHHQWIPDTLMMEKGLLDPKSRSTLQGLGHTLEEIDNYSGVGLIVREKNQWIGVTDPRSTGKPYGY